MMSSVKEATSMSIYECCWRLLDPYTSWKTLVSFWAPVHHLKTLCRGTVGHKVALALLFLPA